MRTIRRRYWHSRQYPGTIDQKSTSSFPLSTESWSQTQHGEMPSWSTRIDSLGRTITTNGVAPQKQKIVKFLEKVKFPRSKKKHFNDILAF